MDIDQATDDKKPLESLEEPNEDETQPDPDETLQLDSGGGKIWLVKIPKFLMERWSTIYADGIHLATLRVWNERDQKTGKQLMSLFLPPEQPDGIPEEYKLDMVQEAVENQIVIAEMDKEQGNLASRAKTTIMSGRIKHEVNVRPRYNENYSNRMRARHEAASEPVRQIKMIEDSLPGGRGNINMLSSGANQRTGSFDSLVACIISHAMQCIFNLSFVQRTSKSARASGQQHERFARMPQNQLLDALFGLFRENEFWSVKDLRLKTEQPEAYLKETLGQIATLHRSGPHNGLWGLMSNFKDGAPKSTTGDGAVPYSSEVEAPHSVKMEGVDDDDDDDDMEEIP
ncbi:transcription initiation factor IIF, beta subunit-domain-containing protein [Gautieria morchelliformis]|nr:transcription initiation factor IIF, beta subunit-domain-containing protein [Gautieria morchelliformis]